MGEFEVLPRVRIRGGRAVRPSGERAGKDETVAGVDRLLSAHGRVLLWDLDGIEGDRPRLDLLRRFEGEEVWVDAGVRTAEGVIDVLIAGAEKAVVGTKTLTTIEQLEAARGLSDDIAVQVDVDVNGPGLKAWPPRRFLEWSVEAGLDACLVLGERLLPEVDVPGVRLGVYVGIATPADFEKLRRRSCRGAIVEGVGAAEWTT